MSPFAVTVLPLAGLNLVERQRLGDSRDTLACMFCVEELAVANHRTLVLGCRPRADRDWI